MAETLYAGSVERRSQCTASSEYAGTYEDEHAFDGAISNAWISDSNGAQTDGSCWLQWNFGEAKKISQMRMAARDGGAQNQFPEDVGLYGSDTGSFSGEETHIQDFTLSQPSSAGEWCDWVTISSPQAFQYLRVEIYTQQDVPGQSSQNWVSVSETEFKELTISNPEVNTGSVSGATETTATLNGTLDDLGDESSVDVYFEWGETTSYGSTTTQETMSATGAFSDGISGLDADQTYHFRAAVTDGVDTWYGTDQSFTTGTTISAECSDGLSLSDSSSRTATLRAACIDGLSMTDGPGSTANLVAQLSDGVTFSDSGAVTVNFTAECSDGVRFADTVAAIMQFIASVSDGVIFSDISTTVTAAGGAMITYKAKSMTFTFTVNSQTFNFTTKGY